jgi:hypothetical protein
MMRNCIESPFYLKSQRWRHRRRICVEKFRQHGDAVANLAALKRIPSAWEQGDFLEVPTGGQNQKCRTVNGNYELGRWTMRLPTPTITDIKTLNFAILLSVRGGDHTWPLGSFPRLFDCYDGYRCDRCGVSVLNADMVKDKSRLVGGNCEPLRRSGH